MNPLRSVCDELLPPGAGEEVRTQDDRHVHRSVPLDGDGLLRLGSRAERSPTRCASARVDTAEHPALASPHLTRSTRATRLAFVTVAGVLPVGLIVALVFRLR